MIEIIKENPKWIIKRMKNVFGKKINFNELMNVIQLNEIKHDVNNVFEFVTNKINERYLNELKEMKWIYKKCKLYI